MHRTLNRFAVSDGLAAGALGAGRHDGGVRYGLGAVLRCGCDERLLRGVRVGGEQVKEGRLVAIRCAGHERPVCGRRGL